MRRRFQLAATPHAIRHWRPERAWQAWHQGEGTSPRSWCKSAGSYRGRRRGPQNEPGPLNKALRLDRIVPSLAQAYLFGSGIAANLPNNVTAFLRSRDAGEAPDIQLLLRVFPMGARPYLPPFVAPYQDGFACRPTPLRPESRGSVHLASTDPLTRVRIRASFLATDNDLRIVREGIRMTRELFQQKEVRAFWDVETKPGPGIKSDDEINSYARATASSVFHPLGTCKMGASADLDAVVETPLKFLGVHGLRVVDASVRPDLIGGNINAAVIMSAEKAADMILGKEPDTWPRGPVGEPDAMDDQAAPQESF